MNGAESLVRTLVAGGVDVCFANPGTSEMHFVAALDRVEGSDEMHLGGAWIGEADVDPARDQCPHQTFRTVHGLAPIRVVL